MKHPTAWVDFEKGDISEDVLVSRFFKDGRSFDSEGIGHMMVGRMPPLTLKSLTHYSRTTTWTGNGTYQYEASEILWSLTAYTRRRSPALTPFSLSTHCPTDAHTCMLPCIMLSHSN